MTLRGELQLIVNLGALNVYFHENIYSHRDPTITK